MTLRRRLRGPLMGLIALVLAPLLSGCFNLGFPGGGVNIAGGPGGGTVNVGFPGGGVNVSGGPLGGSVNVGFPGGGVNVTAGAFGGGVSVAAPGLNLNFGLPGRGFNYYEDYAPRSQVALFRPPVQQWRPPLQVPPASQWPPVTQFPPVTQSPPVVAKLPPAVAKPFAPTSVAVNTVAPPPPGMLSQGAPAPVPLAASRTATARHGMPDLPASRVATDPGAGLPSGWVRPEALAGFDDLRSR